MLAVNCAEAIANVEISKAVPSSAAKAARSDFFLACLCAAESNIFKKQNLTSLK